jgi:hypothetical protein
MGLPLYLWAGIIATILSSVFYSYGHYMVTLLVAVLYLTLHIGTYREIEADRQGARA